MNLIVEPPQTSNNICSSEFQYVLNRNELPLLQIVTIILALISTVVGVGFMLTWDSLDPDGRAIGFVVGPTLILFACAISAHTLKMRAALRAHRQLAAQNPEDVCLADYPWDRSRAVANFEEKARGRFRTSIWLGFAVLPFHYLTFHYIGFLSVETAFLFVYDAIVAAIVISGVQAIRQHQRFGRSEFRFNLYPYFLGETVEGRWWTEKTLGEFDAIEFTLRCVQRKVETDRHNDTNIVTRELYSQKFVLRQRIEQKNSLELPLSIPLPKLGQLETHLSSRNPRHWELRIKLIGSRIPYEVSFLLPVYRRKPAKTS